jgi:RHS repeat-associated protein
VDFFGNTIIERNYGENSPGSTYDDERFGYSTYAFNLSAWLIGLPASRRVTDENGVFVAETRNYYDGAAFTGLLLGQVGLLGDMMREEHFVNGASAVPAFGVITNAVGDPRLGASASINASRNRYDTYGNLVEPRDPLFTAAGQGHAKEYGYDATFHTYVETETIHVGNGSADLVASATYNYGAGVMLSAVNFNSQTSSFQYDSFWRLVGVVKPGDSAPFPTASFEYRPGDPFRHVYYNYASSGGLTLTPTADTDIANAVTTHQREQAGTANTFDTVSFTDGAGHKLGTLHENDVDGQWVAKDFKRFSTQGEERGAFLPFVTASSRYALPTESQPHVTSFYDSANRVVRTVNPPETTNANSAVTETRTIYLPLETILFDEEQANPASLRYGAHHTQLKDGLDRLIGVIEATHLDDNGNPLNPQPSTLNLSSWLTRYEYDLNDNLTHITDSQGNQKSFRYDGLKRKLFMNDPDRGTMTYTYDDASNLRETVDAKSQHIQYTYDGVTRLRTEDYLDANNLTPDVAYHYDVPVTNLPQGGGTTHTAANTKGMLAWVRDLSGEEHTSYDARGRVNWVVKRLPDPRAISDSGFRISDLVSYRTAFSYDSLDRVTVLNYPDNDQITYGYNARNLLLNLAGGPSGYIISSIRYRPSDQFAQIDYGNGTRTTYDYDPRLRLTSLQTTFQPSTINHQLINFSYDFDGVSNIKSIRDQRPGSAVPAGDPRRNTQLFQYDDLYRITRAQYSFALPAAPIRNDGEIKYRYDRIGNMLAQTSTITHDDKDLPVANLGDMDSGGAAGRWNRIGRTDANAGPHALTQIRNPKSEIANRLYPYDANGNMLVIDGLTNTWDFKDRLIRVEDTNMVARYTYDYTDRRVIKRVWQKSSLAPGGLQGHGEGASPSLTTLYVDKYFEVREHDTPVKYVWNGNTRVARATTSLAANLRVQRLRVRPGMNLVSLGVTAANALNQLQAGSPSPVPVTAFKLDPATQTWLPVPAGETLPAGTALWVRAATNATLDVVGATTPPGPVRIPAGASVLVNAGLDSWTPSAFSLQPFPCGALTQRPRPGTPFSPDSQPSTLNHAGPGEALFVRTDTGTNATASDSALAVRYYHQDHLGSSSVMTDAAGQLVEETANYAFGHPRQEFRPRGPHEHYHFTQKERDREGSFHYLERRFYLSHGGRFLSGDRAGNDSQRPDTTNPQRMTPYAYAINNPVVLVDPNGLLPVSFHAQIAYWTLPPITHVPYGNSGHDNKGQWEDKSKGMGSWQEVRKNFGIIPILQTPNKMVCNQLVSQIFTQSGLGARGGEAGITQLRDHFGSAFARIAANAGNSDKIISQIKYGDVLFFNNTQGDIVNQTKGVPQSHVGFALTALTRGYDSKTEAFADGIYVLHSSGRTKGTGVSFISVREMKDNATHYGLGGVGDTEKLADMMSQEQQAQNAGGQRTK